MDLLQIQNKQHDHKKKLAGVISIGFLINNMANFDPTHTTVLRNRFVSEMRKRFRELRGAIRTAVVDQDVLGLAKPETYALDIPAQKAFDFRLSSQKVDGFMGWLKTQEESGVLEIITSPQVGGAIKEPWTNQYIQSAYKKGLQRSRAELKKAGYSIPDVGEIGGIDAIFFGPAHADTAGILYSRTFNELKGITNAMDQQISRVLSQGIIDGAGPATMAREINNAIKKQGATLATDYMRAEQRATILARTEIIRAHNEASLQEFANWEVEGVKTLVEHVGAWDSRMCQDCMNIARMDLGSGPGIFTRSQWRHYFPVHPQCLINGDDLIKIPLMWKKIKDIEVGDLVMTHKGRYKRVMQVHHTLDQLPKVVTLGFEDSNKLSVTRNHLICIGRIGFESDWKRADQIQKGDIVLCLEGASTVYKAVRWIDKWNANYQMTLYNLTVEEDESYIARGIVVHNCRCTPVPVDITSKRAKGKAIVPDELDAFELPTVQKIRGWKKGSSAYNRFLKQGSGTGGRTAQRLKTHVTNQLEKRIAACADRADFDYFVNNWWSGGHSEPIEAMLRSWAATSADTNPLSIILQRAAKLEFGLSKATMIHFDKNGLKLLADALKGRDKARMMKGIRVFVREMHNETQAVFAKQGIKELTVFRGMGIQSSEFLTAFKEMLTPEARKAFTTGLKELGDLKKVLNTKSTLYRDLLAQQKKFASTSSFRKKIGMQMEACLDEIDVIQGKLNALQLGHVQGITKVISQPMSSFSTSLNQAGDFVGGFSGEVPIMTSARIPVNRILGSPRTGFGCLNESEVVVLGGIDEMAVIASPTTMGAGAGVIWDDPAKVFIDLLESL